jgi:hypothetical protein
MKQYVKIDDQTYFTDGFANDGSLWVYGPMHLDDVGVWVSANVAQWGTVDATKVTWPDDAMRKARRRTDRASLVLG